MKYTVVSFSGGKDSTAMLLRMMELGEHIDEVVWCDTYKEFPAMYDHVQKVKKTVEQHGIKFTELRSEKSFDYLMFEHEVKRRNDITNERGYSWARPRLRWCTSRLKKGVIDRHFSQLKKTHDIVHCVGIAADEQYRLERPNNQSDDMRHPLVEWGWTEQDALEYCYVKGYDWNGLYSIFKRVSCWCCPLKSLEELRKLRKHFPDLWRELGEMDEKTYSQFRRDYSVADLEKRFALEEEYQEQGKSITNREFYNRLKDILDVSYRAGGRRA